MAFCSNCGAYAADGTKFCASCGNTLDADPKPDWQENSGGQRYEAPVYQQPVYQNPSYGYTDPGDVAENKLISILCYFGILLLIPYLMKPNSQFVKFHSNQGLLLLLLGIASGIVAIIPILGWIASFVAGIFCFVCWIIGIVNVVRGEMKPLPIIGKVEILK